ncbi:MAG: 30S ribosomal protein S6 [Thermodesulfovibrionales bacterium]
MNTYENIVIFDPSLNEESLDQSISSVTNLISQNGGEILKIDRWGLRKLAYELNKRKQGIYVLLLFKAPSEFIKKLENYYRLQDTVVKFMIIKLGKKELAALESQTPRQEAVASQ